MKKRLSSAFLLLASCCVAQAQSTPAWTWATSLQTLPAMTVVPSLATDAAGNTYVAGGFAQTVALDGGTTLTSQGGQDGFLAKYNPNGSLLWYKQLKGDGGDFFQKLLVDASGNLALLGLASEGAQLGTTTFHTNNFGSALVLTQLDSQGQVQSMREVGSGSLLIPASMARDAAGNFYISGNFALDATFGSLNLTTPISGVSYGIDQFVVKLSADGTPQWAQQGGRIFPTATASTPLFFSHLVADGSGNVYFIWSCNAAAGGFGNLALPTSKGDIDGLVVKFNPQGTPQWAQRLGGSGFDATAYAALDASGRLVVPGISAPAGAVYSLNTAPTTLASTGYLTVLEPNAGATVWSRELQATSAGGFRGVASDASGNLYVAGHFAGQATLGGTTVAGTYEIDALVASYSADGTLRWTQKSTGTGTEVPYDISLDGTGRLAIVGALSGAGQFGNTSINAISTSSNMASPFVAHLGSTVTATRASQAAAPLACYPNPAAATAAVSLPTLPAGTQLTLLDALGHVVRQQPATATLPLAGLVPGLYQVQAVAPSGEQWASRLVVE